MTGTEFGQAVRRWRDRTAPSASGLPAGGRRRAPGLRREELALLAGISVDYLTRLEQGRAARPSEQVVAALGRALRLTDDEHAHLYRLAGLAPPGEGTVPTHITPGVHRMLDRLAGTPVAVSDAAGNLLLANPLHVALMGERRGPERNAVWRTFLGAGSRVHYAPDARRALEAAQVSALRTATLRYPADRGLRRLVADLHAGSARFAELWDAGTVGRYAVSRKTVQHPLVGAITLDCDMLHVENGDLNVIVYTAEPGTEDAGRLALLGVLGAQDLAGQDA
ncbi:helix-turn-helix transcriptional regulator [Actinomadura rayongensis]|uniref:Helix-turn-helix domain-containing protein n=1 Tax=Actinomadura rayongensis TaxID=1429076 RepID=A0A6I4W8A0_9ACTN|nr:helix-turn-helix transcriptional regulator [Actinomadura rayongensis]MXQ65858.1 helix-turn-helix domain-containing protein [Actinomadura rayongensis]